MFELHQGDLADNHEIQWVLVLEGEDECKDVLCGYGCHRHFY